MLKRGYIDVRKEITPYFNARITPDIYLDSSGNTNVRMKYLYGAFQKKELGFIGKPYLEFGMAHMPWLDFEENINRFRMQDTMFMERVGLFNSADIGVLVAGNFGEELTKEYKDAVNPGQAGRWGSFGVGLYNGGGYSASRRTPTRCSRAGSACARCPTSFPACRRRCSESPARATSRRPRPSTPRTGRSSPPCSATRAGAWF